MDVSTGQYIYVQYTVFPAECRNLNYSVFIRSKDNGMIIEYTAKIGYIVYTGHYHKVFRVKKSNVYAKPLCCNKWTYTAYICDKCIYTKSKIIVTNAEILYLPKVQ